VDGLDRRRIAGLFGSHHHHRAFLRATVYEVSGQASSRHLIGFSSKARTGRAGDQAVCRCLLASSTSAFFLPRRPPLTRGWGRAAGEKECSRTRSPRSTTRLLAKALVSAGVFTARAIRPDNRLSVRRRPRRHHPLPCTLKRTRRPIQSRPIERTVPLQVTRRQNGDSFRLAFAASPSRGA